MCLDKSMATANVDAPKDCVKTSNNLTQLCGLQATTCLPKATTHHKTSILTKEFMNTDVKKIDINPNGLSRLLRHSKIKQESFLSHPEPILTDVSKSSFKHSGRIYRHICEQNRLKHLEDCYSRRHASTCYRICFNCSFDKKMTKKELQSRTNQLSYAYTSLKMNTDIQMQYHVSSYSFETHVNNPFQECPMKQWKIHIHSKPYWELFDPDSIIVLSPDAEESIQTFDVSKVYIIGGLVDRSVIKDESLTQARQYNVACYKLPLKHYISCLTSPILNINTVVDIMREVIRTSDWRLSLLKHIPQRRHGIRGPRAIRKEERQIKLNKLQTTEMFVKTQLQHILEEYEGLIIQETPQDIQQYIKLDPQLVSALYQLEAYHHSLLKVNPEFNTINMNKISEDISNHSNVSSVSILSYPQSEASSHQIKEVLPFVKPMMTHWDLHVWFEFLNKKTTEMAIRRARENKWQSNKIWVDEIHSNDTSNILGIFGSSLFVDSLKN